MLQDRKTIPEILFGEFKEGEVYSKQEYSIFYQWARFRNTSNIILVLRKYSDGFASLALHSGWLEEDGKYDYTYSSARFAEVSEAWRKAGIWAYGSGYRIRKAVTYEINYYYGLEITSKESDAALAVMNRAQELTREYVVEEGWSGTRREKP